MINELFDDLDKEHFTYERNRIHSFGITYRKFKCVARHGIYFNENILKCNFCTFFIALTRTLTPEFVIIHHIKLMQNTCLLLRGTPYLKPTDPINIPLDTIIFECFMIRLLKEFITDRKSQNCHVRRTISQVIPKHPSFIHYKFRFNTINNVHLAKAGFFRTPISGIPKCFHCDKVYKYNKLQDPFYTHEPYCHYMKYITRLHYKDMLEEREEEEEEEEEHQHQMDNQQREEDEEEEEQAVNIKNVPSPKIFMKELVEKILHLKKHQ